MGVTKRTIKQIHKDFNISQDVKIVHVKKLTEVAPNGFTCITIGQLEAGLKIPLYHPERPLQYEVLSLHARAPGQMTGNFYRIINEFEDYNKANPEANFSAKDILKLHSEARGKVHAHCFSISRRSGAVLPIKKANYDSSDHKNWHKFPILISGNWIHHPDFPPPPKKYFNPIIWRLNKNPVAMRKEISPDESETPAPPNNSSPLNFYLKESKSNLKNSVKTTENIGSPSKKTQQSTLAERPSLDLFLSKRRNSWVVLRSEDEETSPDEGLQVLKRQKKVSDTPTQVGLGSSVGSDSLDIEVVSDSDSDSDSDPIQKIIDTARTVADHENSVENVSGPWFEKLLGESESSRTGGWKDLIDIGNFPVREKFAALYRQIWQRHGHLATRNVIKRSTFMLVVAVTELLEAIIVMKTVKRLELDASLLTKWDGQIADVEALQFKVGWLRKHFNEVKKTLDDASSLDNSKETHEKARNLSLQKQSVLQGKRDALKVQLAKVEKELEQVTLEVIQHDHAVSEDLAAKERYMSFLQKTFLQDAI